MRTTHLILGLALNFIFISPTLAANWAWTSEPTPGAQNLFLEENSQNETQTFANGTLSQDIILSEIMPNPEGTDTDTEWIEIYNTGTTNINLGNWSLDDEEGGSNPYIFPANTIIEAQDFLVISRSDSNLALNNDSDSVRLFDFEGSLLDEVIYAENAPEGESYARILIEDEQTGLLSLLIPTAQAKTLTPWDEAAWEWTKDITTGATNPIYYFINGTIQEIIPFQNTIRLKTSDQEINVSLNDLNINEPLKNSLFKPGNQITGYASLTSNNTYKLQYLKDNETLSLNPNNYTSKLKTFILFGLIIGVGLLGMYKLHQNKKTEKILRPL